MPESVVGTAEIIITPNTALFKRELEARTAAPLASMGAKSERAGAAAGARLSSGFKGGLSGMETALATLGVPLQTFGGRLDRAAERIGHVDHAGSALTATMAALGSKVLVGAAAGFVGFGAAGVALAARFEGATREIETAANVSRPAAKEISDAFLDAAGKTEFSAQQVTQSYADVAGVLGSVVGHALDAGEATKFMAAAQDLATAAGSDLGATTKDLASVMQAYHVEVAGAGHAGDILYTTSRVTGVELDQLANSLGRLKARLGATAPSLGESAGLLNALAKNGITGTTAMRALNSGFNTLLGGSSKVTEAAKVLGITIFDSSGHFVGLRRVIEQASPKMAELTEHQQLQATKALFGQGANKQLLAIILQGPDAFSKYTHQVERHNSAQDAAQSEVETLQAEVKKLEGAVEALAIKFGRVLIPVLGKVVRAVQDTVKWFEHHKLVAETLARVIAIVLGGAIAAFVTVKVKAFIAGTERMMASLGLLSGTTRGTAASMGASEATMVAETEASSTAIVASNSATGGSFLALGGAASTATVRVGGAMASMAGEVAAADSAIIASNARASFSFTGLLGKIGLVGTALVAAQPLINKLTGGGLAGATPYETKQKEKYAQEGYVSHGHEWYMKLPQGESIAQTIGDFFSHTLKLSRAAIAGILGNFAQETTGEKGKIKYTDTGKEGIGLAQWIGTRRKAEEAYAKAIGLPATALTVQLNFALKEMQKTPGLIKALQKAHSPKEAAQVWQKMFEKAGTPNMPHREAFAEDFYKKLHLAGGAVDKHGHKVDENAKALNKLNAALGKSVEAIGQHTKHTKQGIGKHPSEAGYVDPFAQATHLTRSRTDQGVDFSFAGPLGAIGKGVVEAVKHFEGFGTTIVERLTKGPHAGQRIYYALETGATARAHAGQKVRAGQEIAHGLGRGGVELGFAQASGLPVTRYGPGQSHDTPTQGGLAFSKFLSEVGKGGSRLQLASAAFEEVAKRELARMTADKKAGEREFSKLSLAIQSGSAKELGKLVGGAHERGFKSLVKRLHDDHSDRLKQMAKELVKVHARALTELNKALLKQHEEAEAKRLGREDKINAAAAEARATAIGDETRIALDHAAEAGKAGAELIAAQAQTHLDEVKAADDVAIAAAHMAVINAEGQGVQAEALAQQQLVNAEDAAKINEALAQQALDYANNAAQEAQKQREADEAKSRADKEAEEAKKRAAEEGKAGSGASGPVGQFQFVINGADLTTSEILREVGWALRTGSLPVAPPAHPQTSTAAVPA